MKRTNTVISVVVYGAILAVVLCAVALIFAFVNNGQKNFYVQYGDEQISHKAENVVLPKNSTAMFYCKNVLGITDKQEKASDFAVSIRIKADAFDSYDFSEFTVDEKNQDFFRSPDLTKGFDLQCGDGYFSLYLPETLTLQNVLEKVHAGKSVKGVPDIDLYTRDYLTIVVYSESEKATIAIGFH